MVNMMIPYHLIVSCVHFLFDYRLLLLEGQPHFLCLFSVPQCIVLCSNGRSTLKFSCFSKLSFPPSEHIKFETVNILVSLLLICEFYMQTPFKYSKIAEEISVCVPHWKGLLVLLYWLSWHRTSSLEVHIWISEENIPFSGSLSLYVTNICPQ